MYFDINKMLNILIIAMLSLVAIITLLFFLKISDKSHPYYQGVDIKDIYQPYQSWSRLR